MTYEYVGFTALEQDELMDIDGGSIGDWMHYWWDRFCDWAGL